MKTEIERQFQLAQTMLPGLRERFSARVARWVYSLKEIWSYDDRRFRGTDGDILPGPEGAFHACGFDASDQPILLVHFDDETVVEKSKTGRAVMRTIALRQPWAEEFISHEHSAVEVTRFVRDRLERLSRLTFRNGRCVEEESVIDGCYRHTLIHHEGRRKRLQQSLNPEGRVFFEIDFGPHGQQSYFRVRRDGTRFELYKPLPRGITISSLKGIVRERLIALIPPLVAAASIAETICCVALAYDGEGNDSLPPIVGIGLESERERWVGTQGRKARDLIWNPAEFSHYEKTHTQLSDDALEEACDYLNGKWAEGGSSAPSAKLLVEVCIELNRADWPDSVLRTSDFVVFPVDFEGGHLRKNLKAVLGTEKLAAFKARGLI